METNIINEFLEQIKNSDVKSIEQNLVVDWVKHENGEYIYNGSETITTIKSTKQI